MERASGQHGLLPQQAAAPSASSDSSISSPHLETLAAGEEEAVEAMHAGGRLSATEKGKQKADADLPGAGAAVGVLHPAPAPAPGTEIEEEVPPSPPPPPPLLLAVSQMERNLVAKQAELQQLRGGLDASVRSSSKRLQGGEPRPGDEARCCAGAGVPRRPLGPTAASEIEELPPSPPPPPSRLLAPNVAAAGPAGMAAELERKRAAVLAAMESRLLQLRRERGGEGGSSRRPEAGPRRQDAGRAAEIEMLEREVGTMRDRMMAFRLQQEEMQALRKSVDAWEEFWKPVPVHQRKNSKTGGTCNWIRIISGIAFASGSVLPILFPTLLPLHYRTHIVGAIGVLWTLGSIAICRQLFGESRTTKGFSRHVARFMCVCFLLLVLYSMYLISGYISRLVLLLYRFDR